MHWRRREFRRRWQKHRTRMDAAVAEILRRGVAEGAIRDDVRPEILAHFLVGALRTMSRDLTGVGQESEGLALVVDLFLRGAGAAETPERRAAGTRHPAAGATGLDPIVPPAGMAVRGRMKPTCRSSRRTCK